MITVAIFDDHPIVRNGLKAMLRRHPGYPACREREILQLLLAQGLDNQAIAERLVLTRRTVQNHVSNIYANWWSWQAGA